MRMMSNEPAFALFYIMGRDVLSSPVLLFFAFVVVVVVVVVVAVVVVVVSYSFRPMPT